MSRGKSWVNLKVNEADAGAESCVCVKLVLPVTVKGLVDQIVGFLNHRVKCCLAQFVSLSIMIGWTAMHFQLFFFHPEPCLKGLV